MTFSGRKDDQVKVRGQRLVLGDVQTYLERVLGQLYQAVALVPKMGPLQNALVVALARTSGSISAPGDPHEEQKLEEEFAGAVDKELAASSEVRELIERFEESLPPFMIPSQWIPMRWISPVPLGQVGPQKDDRDAPTG